MKRVHRTAVLTVLALVSTLALAPVAMAADGEGLYGRTDDKVITFFSFGVIAFFAILVIVLSIVQHRLESRKERVREDIERLRQP
jgi:putative copper export protein